MLKDIKNKKKDKLTTYNGQEKFKNIHQVQNILSEGMCIIGVLLQSQDLGADERIYQSHETEKVFNM